MDADVTVREIMTREYVGVSESDRLDEAVDLMLAEGTDGVVVLRGPDPVGMLTADDALQTVSTDADPGATQVGEAMSGTVPSVAPNATIAEAAGLMADGGTGSLLVTGDDELVGVVSERDVVRATATLADAAGVGEPATADPVAAPVEGAERAQEAGGEDYPEATDEEFSTQSVCEICGSLAADLRNFNGQLVCTDCREV